MKKLLTIATLTSMISLSASAMILNGNVDQTTNYGEPVQATFMTTFSLPTVLVDAEVGLDSNTAVALAIAGNEEVIAAMAAELEIGVDGVKAALDELVESDAELTFAGLETIVSGW